MKNLLIVLILLLLSVPGFAGMEYIDDGVPEWETHPYLKDKDIYYDDNGERKEVTFFVYVLKTPLKGCTLPFLYEKNNDGEYEPNKIIESIGFLNSMTAISMKEAKRRTKEKNAKGYPLYKIVNEACYPNYVKGPEFIQLAKLPATKILKRMDNCTILPFNSPGYKNGLGGTSAQITDLVNMLRGYADAKSFTCGDYSDLILNFKKGEIELKPKPAYITE